MGFVRLGVFLLLCVISQTAVSLDSGGTSILKQAGPPVALKSSAHKVVITVPANSYQLYGFDLRSNTSEFRAVVSGATVNVDLFLKRGVPHTANTFQGLISESQFTATSANFNEVLVATRAGSPALTAGRWWLAVLNPSGSPQSIDLAITAPESGPRYVLGAGQSGTWYEAAKNFQGFFFEVLSPTSALIVWFTYEPNGQQAFFTGVGTIEGDRLVIPELTKTRGGRFGGNFDPAQVVRENWGSLVFTFESCSRGYAAYEPTQQAFNAGWPYEQLNTERLTSIMGLGCPASSAASQHKHLVNGASGAWFVPSRDGEGWMIETLAPTVAVVYWFSYTPDGRQAWFGGVGSIETGNITVAQALQPTGGRFGPGYSPSQVSLNPWGGFSLTFTACGAAVGAAAGPADYGAFQYEGIQRLTTLAGTTGCATSATGKTLTGDLLPLPGTYIDGDVNNPDVPNVDNDTPQQVQSVGNPAIVSGFAASVATGRQGDRFASATDRVDAYRVTITAGQTVQLVISDWDSSAPTSKDLDLYVYAAGNSAQPLFSALGTDRNEFVTIPTTGTYDLVVDAFAGFSNYVLSVSSAAAPTATAAMLRLEDREMAAGEVIVRFDEPAPEDPQKAVLAEPARSLMSRGEQLALEAVQGEPGRPMLFRYGSRAQWQKAMKLTGVKTVEFDRRSGFGLSADQQIHYEHLVLIKALRARGDVRYSEPNWIMRTMAIPNDPRYPEQWHYPLINLPAAWDVTTGSPNVVVAVIDSGVAPHPDLEANVRRDLGRDLARNPATACDGDGRDSNADDDGYRCPGLQKSASFHGTHVAGTIAAKSSNGTGVAGVAWQTQIMPVRVGSDLGLDTFDIADGIRWAAGLNVDGTQPSRRADIANLSLGGPRERPIPCPSIYQEAINQARSAGLILVVAAGNENQPTKTPANCQGVLAISAVDRTGFPTAYTNGGAEIAFAAPGGQTQPDDRMGDLYPPFNPLAIKPPLPGRFMREADGVLSTVFSSAPGSGQRQATYQYLPGTSMATPHAAGVLALMKAAHPALTDAQIAASLAAGRLTNDDPGVPGPDPYTGFGIIDAFKAVSEARALAGGGAAPARVLASTTTLEFGETASSLQFTLSATGPGVTVTSLSVSQPWLTLVGSGIGTYTATVNRGSLPTGDYQGNITITPSAGSPIVISVRMRVGPRDVTGNAARVYVFLIDAYTGVKLDERTVDSFQGRYSFSFSGLLPGFYFIVAGSDLDNDLRICDPGEACAVYPSFATFGPIELGSADRNLGGFPIEPDTLGIGSNGAAQSAQRIDNLKSVGGPQFDFTLKRSR